MNKLNKFETSACPLCGQVLRMRCIAGVSVFDCPKTVQFTTSNGEEIKSHYEVEFDNRDCIQHMYVGPWSIDNFANATRSRIYKLSSGDRDTRIRWRLVKEIPMVRADVEEALLDRINKLMTFL